MATIGSLLVAALFLLPQFLHSRHLDRTLPKRWRRLPVFGRFGASGSKRRWALYDSVAQSAVMAVIAIGFSVWQDIDPGVRPDAAMIYVTWLTMLVWGILYLARYFALKRWIRTGKPRIKGLRHPTKNRD